MYNMNELRLAQIEKKIKKAEDQKSEAVILMIISFFFLWPLLIVGAISYSNANKKINRLNEEKIALMFQYNQSYFFT